MSGYEVMGVTIAVQARDVESPDGMDFLRETLAFAVGERLPEHVGGAHPRGQIEGSVKGPVDDPLQGPIYAVQASAMFDPDDLPSGCPADLARRRP